MTASETALREPAPNRTASARTRLPDSGLVLGVMISAAAMIGGLVATGVGLHYFLQPAGALIVLGGTLGVLFLTTPATSLLNTMRRVGSLFFAEVADREALIEEVVVVAREAARYTTLPKIEPEVRRMPAGFLRDALLLAMDVRTRPELVTALENEIRIRERQGEADAGVLEVAGGFAPTLGILGTVVGLVDVLRHFSDLQAVGSGIGMAFVSTLYGLGVANLLLLPAAHRIRARSAEDSEICELIAEGVLCVFDQMHPYMIRQRLSAFLRSRQKDEMSLRGMPNAYGLRSR